MSDRLYIQPLTFAPSPQAFAGDAVRLAGGMAYAREFAVIVRRDGKVAERAIATAATIDEVLGALPDCAGVALGVERLLMCLAEADAIADVLAFPFSAA